MIDNNANTQEVRHSKGQVLRLFRRRLIRSDESYTLRLGYNTIGTKCDEMPADIMIDDEYASRRSVSIALEQATDHTFKYLFTLERSTNPAYFNGKRIDEGASFYLKDGDEFQIGKTTFYLKA